MVGVRSIYSDDGDQHTTHRESKRQHTKHEFILVEARGERFLFGFGN
jgi:hypothetical protein